MNILLTGSSGLIGKALFRHFRQAGHAVYPMSRDVADPGPFFCNHRAAEIRMDDRIGVDVVINLAGETSKGRWNERKKQEMLDSRILTTRLISRKLAEMDRKPRLFVSASAVGFYGDTGGREVDEASMPGDGFLAKLGSGWEAETEFAKKAGIRTVNARFGVVLSPDGGALKEMLGPFRAGLGGKIGNGKQYWSWVGLAELVHMMDFVMQHDSVHGPVNFVARSAVTNAELTRTLSGVLSRPALLHMPVFLAKAVFGEMADEMLLSSCRAVPAKFLEHGYRFQHGDLESTLRAQLGDG